MNIRKLALLAMPLALAVIVLGAFVRLSDAGLGCPDWPGCYGRIDVPQSAEQIESANAAFPDRPVDVTKAWIEMIHRYAAATLGLLILAIGALAWRQRREPDAVLATALSLVALVVFQGLLGMWTVTWQLKPIVVMAHLLGGFGTLALMWWLILRQSPAAAAWAQGEDRRLYRWVHPALAIVIVQVALGGWTSANYAALACPDFPACQRQWWPEMDFAEAFVMWRGLGTNYEYGVLDYAARTAIHMTHRLGALAVLLYVGWLSVRSACFASPRKVRIVGAAVGALTLVQIGLGIANVWFYLPMSSALAHNACAALLVLALVTMAHGLRPTGTGA
ncbi:MAG: COX15/CtaA family protein [Gammaproteobacteria bacterium]|nr:COX15/CtaA family protein [Gammaproteobacteria bacterium]